MRWISFKTHVYKGRSAREIMDIWAETGTTIYEEDLGRQTVFRIAGYSVYHSSTSKGRGYFRLFGVGTGWKKISKYPLLFSERNCKFGILLKGWYVGFLK